MRFVRLTVEAFCGIERAEVEFGPGLNVLYGPNDLGKSTLAQAIGAALLLPPGSSDAERLCPWQMDRAPSVTLTFVDDHEHYYRIQKVFARSPRAELFHAKDGVQFSVIAKNRQVEEKVRELLGWGIGAPGGKGGVKGMPESFLANVLLAAQTDADAILEASLNDDRADSGKLRLQKALSTLAEDPLFKRVLLGAQEECDRYYTPTGQHKRKADSPLFVAKGLVDEHQRERDGLAQELAGARELETQLIVLRDGRLEAQEAVVEAERALAAARRALATSRRRVEAEERLSAARATLERIDGHAARVAALEREVAGCTEAVTARRSAYEVTLSDVKRAEGALESAKEVQRLAASEQAEQQRALRESELHTLCAQLDVRRAGLDAQRARGEEAHAARRALADALARRDELAKQESTLEERGEAARAAVADVDLAVVKARAAVAYGTWRAALARADAARAARHQATVSGEAATARETEAAACEAHARGTLASIATKRTSLPDEKTQTKLEALERECELSDARLGGGLSVTLRTREAMTVRATVDGGTPLEEPASPERRYDAERALLLSVGDRIELEVTAGSVEARRQAEALRARFRAEVTPVLARAELTSLAEIRVLLGRFAAEEVGAREQAHRAQLLRTEAGGLRKRAEDLGQQAAAPVDDAATLEAKRAAVGDAPIASFEAEYARLGARWDAEHTRAVEQLEKRRADANEQARSLAQERELTRFQLGEVHKTCEDCRERAERCVAAIEGADPDEMLQRVDRDRSEVARQRAEADHALAALSHAENAARGRAETAAREAAAAVERSHLACTLAQDAFDAARAKLSEQTGAYNVERAGLTSLDREGAVRVVQASEASLAEFAGLPISSEVEVHALELALERKQRELNERNEEFHKADGALTKSRGVQLKERAAELDEALESARAREREVELDAKAWLLLRETLVAAEKTQGVHLGRALSGPVGRHFTELTSGRYENLTLGPHLSAERVEMVGIAGEASVLDALSVGTRDQLATLVRLTIADQLKSAIILDDHLVHTDPVRLAWFREMLRKTAVQTQVLVFTCRATDYLTPSELPAEGSTRDLAGGMVRAVDLGRVVRRWNSGGAHSPLQTQSGA